MAQGRLTEAIEYFDRSLSIDPGSLTARENMKRVIGRIIQNEDDYYPFGDIDEYAK